MADRVIIIDKETERVVYRDKPVYVEQKKPTEEPFDHEMLGCVLFWLAVIGIGMYFLFRH
jgi:hypothetical protein